MAPPHDTSEATQNDQSRSSSTADALDAGRGDPVPEARVINHKFSPEIRAQLRALQVYDNYQGIIEVFYDWFSMGISVAGSYAVAHYLPGTTVALLAYWAAVVVIGCRMRGLADILHQSAHYTLAQNRFLNLFLGTVFGAWPVLQSWTSYCAGHVVAHHQYLGDPSKDPDYAVMIDAGLYEKSTTKMDVIKFILETVTPRRTLKHLKYLIFERVYPPNEATTETTLRFTYYFIVGAILTYFNVWHGFFLYYVVPLATTYAWAAQLIDFAEHYPLLNKPYRYALEMSRNREGNTLETFLLGTHYEGYHLVHHLWPRMPAWHWQQAHEIMMQDPEYARFHKRPPGWKHIFNEVLEMVG